MQDMSEAKDQLQDETRQQILDAAEARFRQYGFNKTTMAEIAKDCDMSAANLYRFFENKTDIGAHLACHCLDSKADLLQSIVAENQQSAAKRLKDYIFSILEYTHKQWSETPRMNEMVEAMCSTRMDLVDQHMYKKKALLVTLIKEGNQAGEFDVSDPEVSADAILTACTLFDIPLLMPLFSYEALERKAHAIVELILKGLLAR
jgi:AcrR family transcriptional regulator